MNRFNYLPNARDTRTRSRFPAVAIDNRILGPLAALVGTIVLTLAVSTFQLLRLQAAQQTYAAASARLTAQTAAVAEVRMLAARVQDEQRLTARIDDSRGTSLLRANELTWIGNHLPGRVWLVSLRYEAGTYVLEGTAERTAAVGAALVALTDPAQPVVPQLVSLHDDASAGAARVRYRLQLLTAR